MQTLLHFAGYAHPPGYHRPIPLYRPSRAVDSAHSAMLHRAGWKAIMLRESQTPFAGYGWFWTPPHPRAPYPFR